MAASYSIDEVREISRCYGVVAEDLVKLHPSFGSELRRAHHLVTQEVRDDTFAKILTIGELMRGIVKDARRPVSSRDFVLSPALSQALEVAYGLGNAVAPFALATSVGFLRRHFGRKPPRLSQASKEAILRCAAAHASSGNRARMLTFSLPPPGHSSLAGSDSSKGIVRTS